MKVLDLQCSQQHVFEGWFASEDNYLDQRARGLIECPVCGDASITKKLSAPRLNLGAPSRSEASPTQQLPAPAGQNELLQSAWMAVARHIIANTDDVGTQFAEEARKIHYGEAKERGIRGKATRKETESLIDEGIAIMSLPLPEALKSPLQ
jgi:hypothetical protein